MTTAQSQAVETTTQTLTKTVTCPLVTSRRKNARVRAVIDEWQAIAARMADLMPSIGARHWRSQDTTVFHLVNDEFPDASLRSHDAHQAGYKVAEAFASWHANRHEQNRPSFGDGDYARFCHCGVTVCRNDDGWGVKIGLEPYNPEWWHIRTRPYIRRHLERVTDGDASTGSAELLLGDDGSLSLGLSITEDIEVVDRGDAPTTVGVDLGERSLFAAVAMDDDGVKAVQIESGKEFRHHRDRLTQKVYSLMEEGDLRGVRECRNERERYTDHVTHVASREIVDLAVEHAPAAIHLEDLTGYRQSAADAIHDWPFAELQTKVAYKATEEGIPLTKVNPSGTSYTCSICREAHPSFRDGTVFECGECGHEMHADVNAAKNIASGTARMD